MTTRTQRRAHLQNPTQLSPSQMSQKIFWDYIKEANDPENGIAYERLYQFLQECKSPTSNYHEPIVEYKANAEFMISRETNSRFEPVYVTGDFTLPYNKIKAAQALEKTLISLYGPVKEDHRADEQRRDFHQARRIQMEGSYGTGGEKKRKTSGTNYHFCHI